MKGYISIKNPKTNKYNLSLFNGKSKTIYKDELPEELRKKDFACIVYENSKILVPDKYYIYNKHLNRFINRTDIAQFEYVKDKEKTNPFRSKRLAENFLTYICKAENCTRNGFIIDWSI